MKQRAVSAVFIVGATLLAAFLGRTVFTLFVAAVLALAAREFFQMLRHGGHRPQGFFGFAAALGLPLIALFGQWSSLAVPIVVALIFAPALTLLWRPDYTGALTDWAVTVAAALYIGLPAAHFVLLRDIPGPLPTFVAPLDALGAWQLPSTGSTARGLGWFLMAQVVTWASDVGAYLVGRRWGRHTLAPRISPGKTIEGACGGLVWAALAGWGSALAFGLALHPAIAILVGIVLSVAVQLGDLVESLFKRQTGVKDSGAFLPGHGGVFDRIDGLMIAIVVAYYLALAFD